MTPGRTILYAAAGLTLAAVTPSPAQAPLPSHGSSARSTSASGGEGAAGITWTLPGGWTTGAGSAMRVATYVVPGAKDGSDGECAVFYFGPNQGGGVDANVERWERQFKEQPTARREKRTVAGLTATMVDIAGTYTNPGGGMMQSRGEKPDYRLLGAIVEAPQGNVFFKLTAPAATAQASEGDFEALIGSITRK